MSALRHRRLAWAVGAMLALCFATQARAVQILVRAGDAWSFAAGKVRAGDEIILMPGVHKGATLEELKGSAAAPIVIRSLDAKHPAVIERGREGLRLRQPKHVEIRDVTISGCSVTGLLLTDEDEETDVAPQTPAAANGMADVEEDWGQVVVRNVTIRNIGPRGQRHGILLVGMRDVTIDGCTVEGWGGSAVEMVACEQVTVTGCRFKGSEACSQLQGVRARAGSRLINVSLCRFEDAGATTVCIGGASKAGEFRTATTDREGKPAPRTIEVEAMRVERCLVLGGGTAIDLRSAQGCSVRNNTIVRPRGFVLLMAELVAPTETYAVDESVRNTLGANLITWEPNDVARLCEATGQVDDVMVQLEQNLWWSAESAETRAKQGTVRGTDVFGQVVAVDPRLDAAQKPRATDAAVFGMHAP